MGKCEYCNKSIDEEHDGYYYCKCQKKLYKVCKPDYLSHPTCPSCGKALQFHEQSITQGLMGDRPGARGLLGY